MSPRIFITGATGYIGGDILHALHSTHPEYEYTALVRNTDKGAEVAAQYPKVRLVYGSLDDSSVISEAASQADIVVHTADSSDHKGAATAIAAGLEKGHGKPTPGFWIHLSGTGILTWSDGKHKRYGETLQDGPYDDLAAVESLTESMPHDAFHRDIDTLVLEANTSPTIKTAIVCPPCIYGIGRGPSNRRSRQLNTLIDTTLKEKKGVELTKGLAQWDFVHIRDLSDLFVSLVERASKWSASQGSDDEQLWGRRGYFLAENGHHAWGNIAKRVRDVAAEKGFISEKDTLRLSPEQADQSLGFVGLSWFLNSRGNARRAKQFLGWAPSAPDVLDEIPLIVDDEARFLGLKPGHAERVAEASR